MMTMHTRLTEKNFSRDEIDEIDEIDEKDAFDDDYHMVPRIKEINFRDEIDKKDEIDEIDAFDDDAYPG